MSEAKTAATVEHVSASELKSNFGKYLDMMENTNTTIKITKHGRVIAKLEPASEERDISDLLALRGIIPDTGQTKESVREERLREKYGLDD